MEYELSIRITKAIVLKVMKSWLLVENKKKIVLGVLHRYHIIICGWGLKGTTKTLRDMKTCVACGTQNSTH